MSQNQSEYLKPQILIENPLESVTKKPFYESQEKEMETFLNSQIPSDWNNFVHSFHSSEYEKAEIPEKASYKWTQTNKQITISFDNLPKADISIDSNSIKSEVISGNFFSNVESHEINDNEIILHVDNEWPIIISGGDDADKYSLYLMADLSMRAGRLDYYFYWITLSASKNFGPAQKSLALNFLAEQQFDQAMYWFTRLALSENEEFSRTVIAQYLFEANNENSDPFLAENLLVDLVKDGAYDALYYLGYLHLQNLPNWNNNPSLAIRYLEESCGRCNDKVAMQRLANCYRNGIGCVQDLRKSQYYMKMAEEVEKIEQAKEEKANEEESSHTASIFASIIGVAATALGGYYIFKNMSRR